MTCFQRLRFPGKSPIFPMMAPQKQFLENQMAGKKMLYIHLFHFFIIFTSKAPGVSIVFNTKQHWGLERRCHLPVASAKVTRVLNFQEVLTGPLAWHQGLPKKTGQAAVHAQTARRARHHHSARKKEHTGRPQTARAGLW